MSIKRNICIGVIGAIVGFWCAFGIITVLALAACAWNMTWIYLNPVNWYDWARGFCVILFFLVPAFASSAAIDIFKDAKS